MDERGFNVQRSIKSTLPIGDRRVPTGLRARTAAQSGVSNFGLIDERGENVSLVSVTMERASSTCPLPDSTVKGSGNDRLDILRQNKRQLVEESRNQEDLPEFMIESVVWTVYTLEELIAISVVRVTRPEKEGTNSVNDARMGIMDPTHNCASCRRDIFECPGHIGHIEFAKPMYHILAIRDIIKVLNCVCQSCGDLLANEDEIARIKLYPVNQRLTHLEKISVGKLCRREPSSTLSKRCIPSGSRMIVCVPNHQFNSIDSEKLGRIMIKKTEGTGKGKGKGKGTATKDELAIEQVIKIFKCIGAEQAKIMGFDNGSHPMRMILYAIPVIPPPYRQYVIYDSRRRDDELTDMYVLIVKLNEELRIAMNLGDQGRIQSLYGLLVEKVRNFIKGSDGGVVKGRNEKDLLSLKQRLQGKEALIRSFLMGKRVNFSGRTVLSPEPNIKFGQIRVPQIMARTLTVPVLAFSVNIEQLRSLLKAGRVRSIVRNSGPKKGHEIEATPDTEILMGDIVNRWLQNGDYVAFNRQPTLHKQGFMGFEVVLGAPNTIGLHLSYTTAFNADFD